MAAPRYPGFDTLSLHAGQMPDSQFGARATPIYHTTSFVFKSTEHAASLFNMERAGHVYSRISNPTNAVLEERIAALEGGVGAIATASGQAALHLAIVTLMGAGSHIVASRSLYGGSHNLLSYTLPRFGIETTFVDPRDVEAFRAAVRPNTRLLFGETLGNPGLEVLNIPAVADVAHQNGLPLLVDSTFTTPYLIQPFDLGADLVFHSATKFLGGHGVAIGGLLVDSGRFDWEASGKFATLTEPYAGFHDMDFAEESDTAAFLLRARREGLRDFGACMSPMNAFQILQGIETLPLRMARHVDNTRKMCNFYRRTRRSSPWAIRNCPVTQIMSSPGNFCRAAAGPCSASRSRAIAQPDNASSKRCACFPIWPTWATRSPWSFIRRARPTFAWMRRRCGRQALPRARCGFPSASKTRTI